MRRLDRSSTNSSQNVFTAPGSNVSCDRLPVITIDALDECGGLEGSNRKAREDILECFADWATLVPGVKLIITSHAEQDILQMFKSSPHIPLEISTGMSATETSTHDIELHMTYKFKKILLQTRLLAIGRVVKISPISQDVLRLFLWPLPFLVLSTALTPIINSVDRSHDK